MPAVGALAVFAITDGMLNRGQALVTEFTQFGVDGVGVVVGAKRQLASKLTSITFVASRAAADQHIRDATDMIGTSVTIQRDEGVANPITDCMLKSVETMESKAVSGANPGPWKVTLSWGLLAPVDW